MIEIGQSVTRVLAGEIEMQLRVTAITEDRIICGGWEFDKSTGAEIDDDLGWGPTFTGSYIVLDKPRKFDA